MPTQTIYALGESQISVSGGQQLSGITQGTGVHLVTSPPDDPITITLNTNAWEAVLIDDDDTSFADNDGDQTLEGTQTFDGQSYDDGSVTEAEFSILVEDSSGNQYTLYAFNIREPGAANPFGTVEGLAFLDNGGASAFPPIGEPLTVISASEGPTNPYATLATPPCFTPGSLIKTPDGLVDVADLAVGDRVLTLDHGPQEIRWIGQTKVTADTLQHAPRFRPVRIARDAFGVGVPDRAMWVSPQHRIFVSGWRAQLHFGTDEVLAPAVKMCDDRKVLRDDSLAPVTYLHLLFDQHEIIWADGLLSESYFPGDDDQSDMAFELRLLFPELFDAGLSHQTARPCYADKRAIALIA